MRKSLIRLSILSLTFFGVTSITLAKTFEHTVEAELGLPKAYGATAYCVYKFKQTLPANSDEVPVVSIFHVDDKNYEPLVPNASVNIKIIKSESDEWSIEVKDNRSRPCHTRKYIIRQAD